MEELFFSGFEMRMIKCFQARYLQTHSLRSCSDRGRVGMRAQKLCPASGSRLHLCPGAFWHSILHSPWKFNVEGAGEGVHMGALLSSVSPTPLILYRSLHTVQGDLHEYSHKFPSGKWKSHSHNSILGHFQRWTEQFLLGLSQEELFGVNSSQFGLPGGEWNAALRVCSCPSPAPILQEPPSTSPTCSWCQHRHFFLIKSCVSQFRPRIKS